jgi:NADP-dependent aldehyde dehydrogenase
MDLHGKNFIGGKLSARGKATFAAVNPITREELIPVFHEGTAGEIKALTLARQRLKDYRRESAERRADFLRPNRR